VKAERAGWGVWPNGRNKKAGQYFEADVFPAGNGVVKISMFGRRTGGNGTITVDCLPGSAFVNLVMGGPHNPNDKF